MTVHVRLAPGPLSDAIDAYFDALEAAKRMEKPLMVKVAEALGATFADVQPGMDLDSALGSIWSGCRHYDTDWSATGPLIEKYGFHLQPMPPKYSAEPWGAYLVHIGDISSGMEAEGLGATPLLAVCHLILALKAAGKL